MTFNDVEQARAAYHQKSKTGWMIVGTIAAVIAIILFFTIGILSLFFAFFFLILGFIIITFVTSKEAAAYQKAYKAYFVEKNLKSTFDNLYYAHDEGLSRELLRSTGMVNTGDRYHSNDYTRGNYKEVGFAEADVHIEVEHEDNEGHTTYVTIFRGRFMVFEFPKKFNFKLELVGKKFAAYRVPGKDTRTGRKMEKIKTESGEFNKTFRIYGEDGFEAFYLLDPAFMVKIMNISERYKNRVLFGFIDNRLFIGLNDGKDSFEPPKASKPIDEKAETAKISADIKVITDFVDQLSLARRLFK